MLRTSWFAYVIAAAAIALALFSSLRNVSLQADLNTARERTAVLSSELSSATRRLAAQREMIGDLAATDAHHYQLADGEVITRGAHMYLSLQLLPKLPAGRAFQTWTAKKESRPMSPSVIFHATASGTAVVAVPLDASELRSVAVSIEPETGSAAPTGKFLFVQALN